MRCFPRPVCAAFAAAIAVPSVASTGSLRRCGPEGGPLVLDGWELSPEVPHLDTTVELRARGHASAVHGVDVRDLRVEAEVRYCRRLNDCISLYTYVTSFCNVTRSAKNCDRLEHGQKFVAEASWHIPLGVIRGTYGLQLKVTDGSGGSVACYDMDGVLLQARLTINKVRDYRDAFVSFLVASSSSRALGVLFPRFSGGLLPQISGFLFMGIVVGPYCTNLISHLYIFLIGDVINRFSLSFIAGAAGAEIFLPELRELLAPMGLQVVAISVMTVASCSLGLFMLVHFGAVTAPAIALQSTLAAKASVTLLAAALMVTGSPASAIAIISELGCGELQAGKMVLGVTVLIDVAVLILFALCTKLCRVTIEGGVLGPSALLGVTMELAGSALLGLVVAQLLRLVLPTGGVVGVNDSVETKDHEPPTSKPIQKVIIACRGGILLGILYATFYVAEDIVEWTGGRVRLEPLLACTTASCICGHDPARRTHLLESLSIWTPAILLPFFTLAGASLALPSLSLVFPAAVALVVLRMVGILSGSLMANACATRIWPGLRLSAAEFKFSWLTLLAQAGVTLGLVLEIQKSFPGWGQDLGTLVIGVVVLNQLLGPVLCRVGLGAIIAAEMASTRDSQDVAASAGRKANDERELLSTSIEDTAVIGSNEGPSRPFKAQMKRTASVLSTYDALDT
mmetsp:Transcript_8086/g.20129  ORF Transcript_8086/g.20129 Transcript_8086/m.20129 type:complete len:683 (-) Transcript_8086:85-2133(-)